MYITETSPFDFPSEFEPSNSIANDIRLTHCSYVDALTRSLSEWNDTISGCYRYVVGKLCL